MFPGRMNVDRAYLWSDGYQLNTFVSRD